MLVRKVTYADSLELRIASTSDGWSLAKVARELGVSRLSIYKWLDGERTISEDMYRRWCELVGL